MTLPKKNRLKGARAFAELFTKTRPLSSEHFSIRIIRNQTASSFAMAVLIPAKIAPRASARNALRRRIAAAVSKIMLTYPATPGSQAALTLKSSSLPEPTELARELLSLMKKSGILNV